jgi:hypothetical protein
MHIIVRCGFTNGAVGTWKYEYASRSVESVFIGCGNHLSMRVIFRLVSMQCSASRRCLWRDLGMGDGVPASWIIISDLNFCNDREKPELVDANAAAGSSMLSA